MFSNYDNKIQLFYSHSSADEVNSINSRKGSLLVSDWDCSKCGIKNFKRRDKCFKCGITREGLNMNIYILTNKYIYMLHS